MIKSCKDCKFSAPDNSPVFLLSDLFGFNNRWRFAVCKHENSGKSNKADFHHLGKPSMKSSYTACYIVRNDYGSSTVCGPEARLFQPKK